MEQKTIKDMKCFLALLLALSGLSSCSTVHYQSNGKVAIVAGRHPYHTNQYVVEGFRPFYLWGNLPSYQIVNIDEELAKLGIKEASSLTIEEYTKPYDDFFMILSFGMYHVRSFRIAVMGKKTHE